MKALNAQFLSSMYVMGCRLYTNLYKMCTRKHHLKICMPLYMPHKISKSFRNANAIYVAWPNWEKLLRYLAALYVHPSVLPVSHVRVATLFYLLCVIRVTTHLRRSEMNSCGDTNLNFTFGLWIRISVILSIFVVRKKKYEDLLCSESSAAKNIRLD